VADQWTDYKAKETTSLCLILSKILKTSAQTRATDAGQITQRSGRWAGRIGYANSGARPAPFQNRSSQAPQGMTTALILGAAVWPNGPSPTLLRRTRHAADLYHRGDVTRLICCGGIGRHPPSEADVMRDILQAHGIPKSAITLEDQSTTTAQNIRNALALIDGPDVMIVSDRYHLPRACLVARRLGLRPTGSAPDCSGAHMPTQIKQALREVPAYVAYWLRFR